MFCTNCGKQIDDDSNFCTYCGQEVKKAPTIVDIQAKEEPISEVPLTETLEQPREIISIVEEEPKRQPLNTNSKYDETYEKDTMPTVVGFILLFIWLIIYISNFNKQYQSYEEYQQAHKTQDLLTTFNLILRAIVTIWVVNIARFRNRETWSWGILAFLFPAITLIIIGQKKKLKPKLKM